jgi:uncharacterized protein (TIGR00645 family)
VSEVIVAFKIIEKSVEKIIYRSRWVLAPIYLGLSLAVIALGIKFFQEVFHLLAHVFTSKESDLILTILTLIDIAMVGGLLIMVMMSGYENFVSQLDIGEGEEKLGWLGKMDSSSLKAKIAASIVAISSIHLLKQFMSININTPKETFPSEALLWYVVIHMTFVVSAFLMGYLDTKVAKH